MYVAPKATFRSVLRIVPNDAWIVLGLAGTVYALGGYTAVKKMASNEIYYTPNAREDARNRIEGKFNGESSSL